MEGEQILNEGDTEYLTPKEMNLHSFKVLKDMALFNVYLPPYD